MRPQDFLYLAMVAASAASVSTHALSTPLAPVVQSAQSRFVHGSAGTFDLPLLVDITPPTTISITASNPATTPATPSANRNPTLSGAAGNTEAGANVTLYEIAACSGTSTGPFTAAGNGSWSGVGPQAAQNGTTTYYAQACDAAGNCRCSSPAFNYYTANTFALTVSATGTGSGTVTSTPAGISCPGTCSAAFASGALVNLAAKPNGGSNSYFESWGGDCAGPARLDCNVTMDQARSVTALFPTQTFNTVFASSTLQPVNRGSAVAYDTVCNTLATAAGLNSAAGNAYIAWTSDSNSTATARLGTARGFVRVDGKPFADANNVGSMLSPTNKIFNAPSLDENGRHATQGNVLTGANADGTHGSSCSNFTSTSGGLLMTKGANNGSGGPVTWTAEGTGSCGTGGIIVCMMKTKIQVLTPALAADKKVYLTSGTFVPQAGAGGGINGADALCVANKPAGVTTAKAMLATTAVAASAAINPAASYGRLDGQRAGTGAELIAGGALESGIWQDNTGAYVFTLPWTGSALPTDLATPGSNCSDWTTSAGTGLAGDSAVASDKWWNSTFFTSCNSGGRLYCVEQ